MIKGWRTNLAGLLAMVLVVLAAYRHARAACTRDCLEITQFCKTDNQGLCITSPQPILTECYKYEQSKKSCWTCGKGIMGAMNGWCDGGDPNAACTKRTPELTWKKYGYCIHNCGADKTNTWVEAAQLMDPLAATGKQDLYECVAGK